MPSVVGFLLPSVVAGLLLSGAVLSLACSFRLMRFPDITVEGSFLIGAAVWAALVRTGFDTTTASLVAAIAGASCGATTAMLNRWLGIDRFLSGILVTASCYSIAILALGSSNVGLFDAPPPLASAFDVSGSPIIVSTLFALAVGVVAWTMFKSRAGLRARTASANPTLLENLGSRPILYLALGLAFTNTLSALSGVMFARYQGFVDVGMGQGVLIIALAALAIGEAATWWLRLPLVWVVTISAIVGSIAYQAVLGIALTAGAPAATTKLVSAAIVVVFLAMQRGRRTQAAQSP